VGDAAQQVGPGSGPGGHPPQAAPARVLFVCLGNICRSPTAEGVMRSLVARAGLAQQIEIDSAGTGSWHVGSPPDGRAWEAARARGIELSGSARQVGREDFVDFDLLIAMDRSNLRDLRALAPGQAEREKVRLLREYDPQSPPADDDLDVPDPYYDGGERFELVLDLVEAACAGLLAKIVDGRAP
jgi:protein-tyrosine phosphatase